MTKKEQSSDSKGLIFNIQRYSTEDGPGIRTTVFFQGCPLSCLWCSNPESQLHKPQMLYFDNTCVKCYSCVEVCPTGANQKKEDGSLWVDRDLCTGCGACVKVCLANARSVSGNWMTVSEVFDIVNKDSLYYANSGGGITLGGGECTSQPKFALELLSRCYDRGIHTCIDTCGYTPWSVLAEILKKVDLVLLDIKHLDPSKHKEFTGVDNQLILDNAARMKEMGKEIIIRIPLIPGYNFNEKSITAAGRFMKLWGLERVDILPYHRLGVSKHYALGQEYPLEDLKSLNREEVQSAVKILESFGLNVGVV